jgi:hypothetical protein
VNGADRQRLAQPPLAQRKQLFPSKEFGAWLQSWGAFMLHQPQRDASAQEAPPEHWRALTAAADPPEHWLALLRAHGVEWPGADVEQMETAVAPAQPWTLDGQPLDDVPPAAWLRWFMAGFHDFVLALAGPEAVAAVFSRDPAPLPVQPPEAEPSPAAQPAERPAAVASTPPFAAPPTPGASHPASASAGLDAAIVQMRRPAAAPPLPHGQPVPDLAAQPSTSASPLRPAQLLDAVPQASPMPASPPTPTDFAPAAPAASPAAAAETPRLARRLAPDHAMAPETPGVRVGERAAGAPKIHVALPPSPDQPASLTKSAVSPPSPPVTAPTAPGYPAQRTPNPALGRPTPRRETDSPAPAPAAAAAQAPAAGDRPMTRPEPSPPPPPDDLGHSPPARPGGWRLPSLKPRPAPEADLPARPFVAQLPAQLQLPGEQERETAVGRQPLQTTDAKQPAPQRVTYALDLPTPSPPSAPDGAVSAAQHVADPIAPPPSQISRPSAPTPTPQRRSSAPEGSRSFPTAPIQAAPPAARAPGVKPASAAEPAPDRSWTWPELPPAPPIDNPGYHNRTDPARRRRLAREQRGR